MPLRYAATTNASVDRVRASSRTSTTRPAGRPPRANLTGRMLVHVNPIPLNPTPGSNRTAGLASRKREGLRPSTRGARGLDHGPRHPRPGDRRSAGASRRRHKRATTVPARREAAPCYRPRQVATFLGGRDRSDPRASRRRGAAVEHDGLVRPAPPHDVTCGSVRRLTSSALAREAAGSADLVAARSTPFREAARLRSGARHPPGDRFPRAKAVPSGHASTPRRLVNLVSPTSEGGPGSPTRSPAPRGLRRAPPRLRRGRRRRVLTASSSSCSPPGTCRLDAGPAEAP